MALKTTIAAALAALTMTLFAGSAAEAKTKVVIGIGNVGWGAHSCWGWPRRCGWRPGYHAGYYRYYAPRNRIVVYNKGYAGPRYNRGVSCGTAARIVDRSGYSGVRINECRGSVYTFNARKNGRFYRVRVNANNGNIIGRY